MAPPHVHVSNSDGSGDTVLTVNGGGFDPSWSPDGTRIAFARYVGCCNPEIYVMNADGSDERRLTTLDGFDMNRALECSRRHEYRVGAQWDIGDECGRHAAPPTYPE